MCQCARAASLSDVLCIPSIQKRTAESRMMCHCKMFRYRGKYMSARSGVREKVPKLLGKRSQCSPGQNPKAPWVSLVGLPRRSPSSVLGGNDKRLKTEFRNSGILESVCAGKRIVYQWKASSRKPCHRVSPASPKDQFHTPTHRFQNSGIPEFHFPLLFPTLKGMEEMKKTCNPEFHFAPQPKYVIPHAIFFCNRERLARKCQSVPMRSCP